jgi:hypothetical protein
MIQVTEKQVEKYMDIYLAKHGVPIDPQKAAKELRHLVCLLVSVHKHMHKQGWPDLGITQKSP